MKIIESYIRPWKGELVVGQVISLSGEHVVCRTANGFEFRVSKEDVLQGRVDIFDGPLFRKQGSTFEVPERAMLS